MVEFFNSFGTERVTGSTVAVGFVFFIMCVVILILLKIDKYISVKINESELSIRLKMLEEERNSKEKQDPYFYRLDSANKLVTLIESMIADEISQLLFSYTTVREKYKLGNIDIDAEKITKSVYDGINKDFLTSQNSFFTNDYIMKMISRITVNSLIDNVRTWNEKLRSEKLEM